MSRSTTLRRVLVSSLAAYASQRGEIQLPLSEEESTHLSSVLRLSDGDEVEALDGEGRWAKGLLQLAKKRATILIQASDIHTEEPYPTGTIELQTALLKGDAMDWLIEKSVELGVTRLQPLMTEHSVVRVKGERGPDEFQSRWQRMADQALKQCGRRHRMEVMRPLPLMETVSTSAEAHCHRIWLDESSKDESIPLLGWLQSVAIQKDEAFHLKILLGPEGGFSYLERELLSKLSSSTGGITRVSLGRLMLRAETAGIASVAIVIGELLWKNSALNPSQKA